MYKNTLLFLFCLTTIHSFAITGYQPGDSLWVWAENGLHIRAQPNAQASILGKAPNGAPVISCGYPETDFPYAVEVIRKSVHPLEKHQNITYPNFQLTGYWTRITYPGIVGYVFDGYLSKQPTITGHQFEAAGKEDFHVSWFKTHTHLLQQTGTPEYGPNDQKFVRYIFDTGHIIEISGGSGYWEKEMLFPGHLSVMEGYLIYAHTMKSEQDILLEKGEDFLKFEIETGFLTIKRVGSFLIFYEEHSC
jgi:hypothetical protein